jgi:hypothetical protein
MARNANGIFMGCSIATFPGISDPAILECMALDSEPDIRRMENSNRLLGSGIHSPISCER